MVDESFGVEVVNANGRAIVSLRGEIDMSCGPALRDALSAAQQGSPDVIVDLSGVTFMDSTGLNALIGAYHRAPEGGSLGVVGPHRPSAGSSTSPGCPNCSCLSPDAPPGSK